MSMNDAKSCTRCGESNTAIARFCRSCGTSFAPGLEDSIGRRVGTRWVVAAIVLVVILLFFLRA